MMRLVLGLVATLGVALAQAQPAEACGVKLTLKSPKVKHTKRSSNPSSVLVLGDAPKRLAQELTGAGHSVEVASSADGAAKKDYQVVVVDSSMQDEAKERFPGARIVARSASVSQNIRAVEDNVAKAPTRTTLARRATNVSQRRPVDVGPRADDRARPVDAGGSESIRTGGPTAAGGDTAVEARATVEPAPAPTPEPPRRTEDVPRRERPARAEAPVASVERSEVDAKPRARLHKELRFGGGSSDVSGSMLARLDANARWLAANPGKSVTIEGHASQVGSAELNRALSEARANAVKDYLVQQGVDASRIQVVGHGFEQPAYQPPSSARNRRVSIVISD